MPRSQKSFWIACSIESEVEVWVREVEFHPSSNGFLFQDITELVTEKTQPAESGSSPLKPNAWLGFEGFDLLVMTAQAVVYLTGMSLSPLFSNSAFRFLIGTGFFVAIYFLSRTRTYSAGVKKIQSEHEYLGTIVLIGGAVLGIIVLALFVFGPIKVALDYLGWPSGWLGHLGVPLSIIALGYLPFLSFRAGRRPLDDDSQFANYSPFWMYAGRAVILILANLILLTMYQDMVEENQVNKVLTAVFFMSLFYVPVRMQEMYLHPHGPHFQSLLQTIVLMALGNASTLLVSR